MKRGSPPARPAPAAEGAKASTGPDAAADRSAAAAAPGSGWKDSLEIGSKAVLGLSGALYLIGFLVVNAYLGRFGYATARLLSAQYLAAGVWALMPVVVGWGAFALAADQERPVQSPRMKKVSFVALVLLLVLGWIGSGWVLLAAPAWVAGLPVAGRWLVLGAAGFFLSLLALAGIWSFASLRRRGALRQVATPGGAGFLVFVALALLLAYLFNFARSLYGEIPGAWGGGRPRPVRVVAAGDERRLLIAAGLPFRRGSLRSEPVRLLVAAEDEIVFLIGPRGVPVSVRSDLVQAVAYTER